MRWELVGKQELRESGTPGKGHVYAPLMWRTPVPGGWLLLTVNSKSSDPQPTTGFYPDPDHVWNCCEDPRRSTCCALRVARLQSPLRHCLPFRAPNALNKSVWRSSLVKDGAVVRV